MKIIPWTKEELDLLAELWATDMSNEEIWKQFPNRTPLAVKGASRRNLKLSGRYIKKWTPEEIEELKTLWMSDISNKELLSHYPDKTIFAIRAFARRKLKLPNRTQFIQHESITWTQEESDLLVSLWTTDMPSHELALKFPNKTPKSLDGKATRLKLPSRPSSVKKNAMSLKNKKAGRDLSVENLLEISKKYKSRTQFLKEDSSAYVTARNLGLLDEMTHLTKGLTFNYPQTALFEIVKILFPNRTVRNNDRTRLKPKEIDVFVVEDDIGFEYDGVNYHSSEEDILLDRQKDLLCEQEGIKLYRIREVSKNKPIPYILDQLEKHGFDVSTIDIKDIQSKITKYYMSLDDIKDLINSYEDRAMFIKENPRIVSFLRKQDMMGFTNTITNTNTRRCIVGEQELIDAILQCKLKNDILINYMWVYRAIIKNKEKYPNAYALYGSLPTKKVEYIKLDEKVLINKIKSCTTKKEFIRTYRKEYDVIKEHKDVYAVEWSVYQTLKSRKVAESDTM